MSFLSFIKKRSNPVKYWSKKGVVFGKNVEVHPTAYFDTEPYLIRIGNNVKITSDVRFVTHDGGAHVLRMLLPECKNVDIFKGKIIVGDNTFIGNKATILPGVTVGSNCIIGYGSIVTKNIPDNSVACGVPARVVETIDEYKKKNEAYIVNTKHLEASLKKTILIKRFK